MEDHLTIKIDIQDTPLAVVSPPISVSQGVTRIASTRKKPGSIIGFLERKENHRINS